METRYRSTRSENESTITASRAILKGISPDNGLYVPQTLPKLQKKLSELMNLDYVDLAYNILQSFFSDFTEEELRDCLNKAYGNNFTSPKIAPISYHGKNAFLELYHGPTLAFKDIALQLLPHLLVTAAKKNHVHNKIVILTATSGDTGKAAMDGFANVSDTQIIVFYPNNGVSSIQKQQMLTQVGNNISVIGIDGNFDDAQTNVKKIFNNQKLHNDLKQNGFQFSSANSINIGRLFPQVVYYFYAYSQLVNDKKIKLGDKINFSVPTGNFGDILAGYYAKKLGLPIKKLLCASNQNNVLTDFFNSGIYDKNRDFHVTDSPSMDILVSSNLERLLFYATDENSILVKNLMDDLYNQGNYKIDDQIKNNLTDFVANFATDNEIKAEIKRVYDNDGAVIDPHTAVASYVANQYQKETGDQTPMVIVSTANPYKFPKVVLEALNISSDNAETDVRNLHQATHMPIPSSIKKLFDLPILYNREIKPTAMEATIRKILQNS